MCNCKFSVKICSRREERHKKRHNLSAAAEKINQNNNNNNNKIGEPAFFWEIVLPEKPAMDEKRRKTCAGFV